jgi:hypothetical protein
MPGVIVLGINLANFYLNTPMPNPKNMRLQLDIIPEEIIVAYNLRELVTLDGWVYIEICKGMYGLPQASILANQLLEKMTCGQRVLPMSTHPGPMATYVVVYHVLPCH